MAASCINLGISCECALCLRDQSSLELDFTGGLMIKYIEGDLFEAIKGAEINETVYIPHVCNNKGAWGRGFVLSLYEHFPKAREAYLEWFKTGKVKGLDWPFSLGANDYVSVASDITVVNMVAQVLGGKQRPLHYPSLSMCMEAAGDYMLEDENENPVIYCPFFGAGLAGGNWEFIIELIKDCWLDRGIFVNVCYLPGMVPVGFKIPK